MKAKVYIRWLFLISFIFISWSYQNIIFSELMWTGSTTGGTSDEWVELRNMTSDTFDISANNLSVWKYLPGSRLRMFNLNHGKIPPGGFFLIARKDTANSILAVRPDTIVTSSNFALTNSDVQYKIFLGTDTTGVLLDIADDGSGIPLAGDNATKRSMERNIYHLSGRDSVGPGNLAGSWHTAYERINLDPGVTDRATPKSDYHHRRPGSIIINEVMWMGSICNEFRIPPSDRRSDEWVELYNASNDTVEFNYNPFALYLWYAPDTGSHTYSKVPVLINRGTLYPGGYFVISNFGDSDTLSSLGPGSTDLYWTSGSDTFDLFDNRLQLWLYDGPDSNWVLIDQAGDGTRPGEGVNYFTRYRRYSMARRRFPQDSVGLPDTVGPGNLMSSWETSTRAEGWDTLYLPGYAWDYSIERGTPRRENRKGYPPILALESGVSVPYSPDLVLDDTTRINFRIKYSDMLNRPPSVLNLYLDRNKNNFLADSGEIFPMMRVDATDSNFVDGVVYQAVATLTETTALGAYYFIRAYNGDAVTIFPEYAVRGPRYIIPSPEDTTLSFELSRSVWRLDTLVYDSLLAGFVSMGKLTCYPSDSTLGRGNLTCLNECLRNHACVSEPCRDSCYTECNLFSGDCPHCKRRMTSYGERFTVRNNGGRALTFKLRVDPENDSLLIRRASGDIVWRSASVCSVFAGYGTMRLSAIFVPTTQSVDIRDFADNDIVIPDSTRKADSNIFSKDGQGGGTNVAREERRDLYLSLEYPCVPPCDIDNSINTSQWIRLYIFAEPYLK